MKPVVKVIQTAKNEKQAWRKLDDLELFKYYNFRMNTVSVDSSISYQKLLGFGGAFTEAAAYTWANADEKSKDERSLKLAKYIKYGTISEDEIWMLRYGFDFEDIEWIKPCVASIDKTEIVFNDKVDSLSEEQLMRIDRFR